MTNEKDINLAEFYSAKKVVDMKVLPWKTRATFLKSLALEPWKSIFNPIIEKKAKRNRYFIKGADIVKYMKMHKDGEFN